MGNRITRNTLLVMLLALSSCEKMELRGFVTSYENANERFEQSMEWNGSHPDAEINLAQNDYTLFAMGDSHVGGTENLQTFFQAAMDESIAAAVLVGDLTTGHESDYQSFSALMPAAESLTCFPMAGNHDLYFDGWKQFHTLFGSSTYYFAVNTPDHSDLFICLDSGSGTLGEKQFEWFRHLLETSRKDYRFCMVFTHNNLIRMRPTSSTNPFVEENQALLDLFIRHRVNMVVTAHDHKRNTLVFGNTVHVIMDSLQDENEDASYLRIMVDEQDFDFSFIRIR